MKKVLLSVTLLSLVACSTSSKSGPADPDFNQEDFARLVAPGEQHQMLSQLSGEWAANASFWMGGKEINSKATMNRQVVLGGRFVQEDYREIGGQNMNGVGLIGYNNAANKFSYTWADTMGTGVFTSLGEEIAAPAGQRAIQFTGEQVCPVSGEKASNRSVLRMISPSKQSFEVFQTGADGEEQKLLEVVYTR